MEENEIFGNPEEQTEPANEIADIFAEETETANEPAASHSAKKPKNKYNALSILFKVVAVLVFLLSLVCGIAFGFTEATTLVPYGPSNMPSLSTVEVFEVWRAVLFGIVGLSNGICLWAVSEVFSVLAKKVK